MNHTPNYNLPQWELDDLIRMEDFNAMNSSIEAGLDSNAATAASAVNIANFAKATAIAASQKPYVVGTYTGTGETIDIELGFRPSFLIVSGMKETRSPNSTEEYDRSFAMTGGHIKMSQRLKILDTGFRAFGGSVDFYRYPAFSDPERVYDYIAFK